MSGVDFFFFLAIAADSLLLHIEYLFHRHTYTNPHIYVLMPCTFKSALTNRFSCKICF